MILTNAAALMIDVGKTLEKEINAATKHLQAVSTRTKTKIIIAGYKLTRISNLADGFANKNI